MLLRIAVPFLLMFALGGCAVVSAGASVVGAAASVAGSAAGAAVDVTGAAAKGAVNAVSSDDEKD